MTILDPNSYDFKIKFCFVNAILKSSTFLGEEQILTRMRERHTQHFIAQIIKVLNFINIIILNNVEHSYL